MSYPVNIRENIHRNMEIVREKIGKAARMVGRSPDEVKLLVVTKTHSMEIIHYVLEAGAFDLGENYVEEARDKIIALQGYTNCIWHMIGHVQSRKSSQVVEFFDTVQSLDSIKLARRLSANAVEAKKTLPVLLEMSLGGEESKSGWRAGNEFDWEAILPEIDAVVNLPNLRVCGLMTVPPCFDNPEDVRPYFQRLRHLREDVQKKINYIDWKELSMGMSGDYEVAIEEGATWVRIGQAILGPRHH